MGFSRLHGLCWAVLGCTGFYCTVMGTTGQYWTLLGCTRQYWAALGNTGLYWAVLSSCGLYWAVLGCTGLYRALLGCKWGLLEWLLLVDLFPKPFTNIRTQRPVWFLYQQSVSECVVYHNRIITKVFKHFYWYDEQKHKQRPPSKVNTTPNMK